MAVDYFLQLEIGMLLCKQIFRVFLMKCHFSVKQSVGSCFVELQSLTMILGVVLQS